jgi:pimeloyl-ACP methyl ester carboxylesterase
MIVSAWIVCIGLVLLGLVLGGLALFSAWTARQVEKVVPPLGRFIEVDGSRIHYLDEGSGPPILFIHGLAGQMRNFTHSLLERFKNDYRVVILDRPGSGYSTRPPHASATISAQAATISRFAEALGLKQPLVVGHSLGGAIALALAMNHPEQVSGLALIAPVTDKVPAVFVGLAIASPLVRLLVAWIVAVPLSMKNRDAALGSLFGPQPVTRDFATKGGGLLFLRPKNFIGASCDLVAPGEDLDAMQERYAGLKIPVGVLYGTDDGILETTAHCEALASKLPGADFELIEGGGHMTLISSADRAAKFIARMAQRAAAPVKRAAIG